MQEFNRESDYYPYEDGLPLDDVIHPQEGYNDGLRASPVGANFGTDIERQAVMSDRRQLVFVRSQAPPPSPSKLFSANGQTREEYPRTFYYAGKLLLIMSF